MCRIKGEISWPLRGDIYIPLNMDVTLLVFLLSGSRGCGCFPGHQHQPSEHIQVPEQPEDPEADEEDGAEVRRASGSNGRRHGGHQRRWICDGQFWSDRSSSAGHRLDPSTGQTAVTSADHSSAPETAAILDASDALHEFRLQLKQSLFSAGHGF